MRRDLEDFIAKFIRELRSDNAAVFAGAGLSKAAGFVDWVGLLTPIARSLGLDAGKESDLVRVAQYHVNQNGNQRGELNQLLVEQFADVPDPTENHEILASLPIKTFWTTNYDRLIEKSLELAGKRVDSKYTTTQLATTRRGRDATVYKMHGDIEHPHDAVLTRDDYERYQQTHGPFVTALLGDLVEKTFLFVGFSFTDPNLDYILARIRARFERNQRLHYCIMKRRSKFAGESDDDFTYATRKQELMVNDLQRFNIRTIYVDEYHEITEVLRAISLLYRRKTVFISGSASDYGAWGERVTQEFVAKLARALIDRDLRITAGFGLGLGSAIVTGAVQQIYSTPGRSIEDQLVLRPFPIGIENPAERQRTFQRYRQELIKQAGVSLFLLGNKESGGRVVNADGVRAEFELAKANGLYVIPIGSSGWLAKDLWDEVMGNFATFFPTSTSQVKALMEEIGIPTADPNTLIEPILKLLDHVTKE